MSDYLTIRQVADKLGRRSLESVRKLLVAEGVPLVKLGKFYQVATADYEAWLRSRGAAVKVDAVRRSQAAAKRLGFAISRR